MPHNLNQDSTLNGADSVTLRDLIKDCGGPSVVARRLQRTPQAVHKMMRQGHLPLTELQGKTAYSEALASMQKEGSLSAAEIRRIGFRL